MCAKTGGLDYEVYVEILPGQKSRILLAENGNALAVYYDAVFGVAYFTVKLTVHRVILEHICHIVRGQHIVDAYEFNVFIVDAGTEGKSAYSSEAVNGYFNFFHNVIPP